MSSLISLKHYIYMLKLEVERELRPNSLYYNNIIINISHDWDNFSESAKSLLILQSLLLGGAQPVIRDPPNLYSDILINI